MASKTFLLLLLAVFLISSLVISARDLAETSPRNKDDVKGVEEADDHQDRYSTQGGWGGYGGPWGGYGGQWGGYGGPWGGYGGPWRGGYGGPWGGYGGPWGWYGGGYGGRWGKGWCRFGTCTHGHEAVKTKTEAEPRG